MDNKIRLEIIRPVGSFDRVEVRCPVEQPQIIFQNTPPDDLRATVDCSFLPSIPLMNVVITTIKQGFNPAVIDVTREGKSIEIFLRYHRRRFLQFLYLLISYIFSTDVY